MDGVNPSEQNLASEFESGRISSSSTSLEDYFSASSQPQKEHSSPQQEGKTTPAGASTPRDDYFPSPLSQMVSARVSFSDGEISPYEQVDIGEPSFPDTDAKSPKSQEPEITAESLVKKHSIQASEQEETKEKKAPNRKAPSRQAPSARKPAAVANLIPPVVVPRERVESVPPPPPDEDPPPSTQEEPEVEQQQPPQQEVTIVPKQPDEEPEPKRSPQIKAFPPPPPLSERKAPPSPLFRVTGPSSGSQKDSYNFPESPALLSAVSESQLGRRSSGASENDEEPPPPPRVPGPKPPPRANKSPEPASPMSEPLTPSHLGGRPPFFERMSSTPFKPEDDGPTFANSLPHNFEAVSNQVGVGMRQTKSLTALLKSIVEIQREATQKIAALIDKEQRKQFMDAEETPEGSGAGRLIAAVTRDPLVNPKGKDGMDRFAKLYEKTIGFLAQEAADQITSLNNLEANVVMPLTNLNLKNSGRLHSLAQMEKNDRESMTESSKQVKKAQENCMKLLDQAIQARLKEEGGNAVSPAAGAKTGLLRTKVNLVSQKISTGQLVKAQKLAVGAAEAYEAAINEANFRQKRFHSQDLPSLFTQLEALERNRLKEVSQILVKLIETKSAANEPREQSCNRLKADSKDLDAQKDMMDFLQRWIALSGAPPPPVPFSYQCPCTPQDIARGRFENSASCFHDTLGNIMSKQQAQFPEEKVPHIMEVCIKAVADNGGFQSEGIFRISIPKEELDALIKQIEVGEFNVFPGNANPHAAAALLKQWLRMLDEPIVPPEKYAQAVVLGAEGPKGDNPEGMAQFVRELPPQNQDLLRRIAHGLVAEIVKPENIEKNRMSVRNLAIVFAPGFLRNSSDDPMEMLNSQRFEQNFVCRLFECLLKEHHL